MNIDYSLCEALKHGNLVGITDVLLIYDVMCQYHVNLERRVSDSTFLALPDTLKLIKGIGLFHVHCHQEECLYMFGTSNIPGAARISGEILESLWAVMNEVSRGARTATLAHRSEILDDHMGDSNWKKMLHICESSASEKNDNIYICQITGNSVIQNYQKAVEQDSEASEYFADLTASVPSNNLDCWQREIEEAEANRDKDPTRMLVMKSRLEKGVKLCDL